MKKRTIEKPPVSKKDLVEDFEKIGIEKGMNLMVHSSLSKIGWVIGGAQTIIDALFEVVGKNGTLVMPSATPFCLHPEDWDEVDVPKKWMSKIAKNLPAFDSQITPTTMGAIPETFRIWQNTLRSNHPISSVCANGKLAKEITELHNLEISEGKNTPYEKVYEFNFNILLLGVGFNRCTMLHFAESKSENRRLTTSKYQIVNNNKSEWVEVLDMGNDNGTHFPKIGELYLKEKTAHQNKIGNAESIMFNAKELVDFGTEYFDSK